MTVYTVIPCNRYGTYRAERVESNTPMAALKTYLKITGIKYCKVERCTNQLILKIVKQNKLQNIEQITGYIDFIVTEGNKNQNSLGNIYIIS